MRWGKRHHTLEELDLDDRDDQEVMQSGSRDAGAGAYRKPQEPIPGPIGSWDYCWCGKPFGHPGSGGNGEPHQAPEREK